MRKLMIVALALAVMMSTAGAHEISDHRPDKKIKDTPLKKPNPQPEIKKVLVQFEAKEKIPVDEEPKNTCPNCGFKY